MKIALQAKPPRRGHRPGFTLIELSIAVSIMMIGIVSVISATSRMHSLRKETRERTLAQNALRTIAERVHARSHGFSEDPLTWGRQLTMTYGPAGNPGNTFNVRGLALVDGDASNGTLRFVTDETLVDGYGPGELGARIGMPRDLNGDGDSADTDVTDTARVLPVLLTLRWKGQSGVSEIQHAFFVMGY